jgi:hypothetical protein
MKLSAAGLGDDILRWFRSYLSDRRQLVDVSGTHSSAAVVKNKLLLYADDSGNLVSGKNKADVEHALKENLHLVSQWLVDNKLPLHLGKTESILFGSEQS